MTACVCMSCLCAPVFFKLSAGLKAVVYALNVVCVLRVYKHKEKIASVYDFSLALAVKMLLVVTFAQWLMRM